MFVYTFQVLIKQKYILYITYILNFKSLYTEGENRKKRF